MTATNRDPHLATPTADGPATPADAPAVLSPTPSPSLSPATPRTPMTPSSEKKIGPSQLNDAYFLFAAHGGRGKGYVLYFREYKNKFVSTKMKDNGGINNFIEVEKELNDEIKRVIDEYHRLGKNPPQFILVADFNVTFTGVALFSAIKLFKNIPQDNLFRIDGKPVICLPGTGDIPFSTTDSKDNEVILRNIKDGEFLCLDCNEARAYSSSELGCVVTDDPQKLFARNVTRPGSPASTGEAISKNTTNSPSAATTPVGAATPSKGSKEKAKRSSPKVGGAAPAKAVPPTGDLGVIVEENPSEIKTTPELVTRSIGGNSAVTETKKEGTLPDNKDTSGDALDVTSRRAAATSEADLLILAGMGSPPSLTRHRSSFVPRDHDGVDLKIDTMTMTPSPSPAPTPAAALGSRPLILRIVEEAGQASLPSCHFPRISPPPSAEIDGPIPHPTGAGVEITGPAPEPAPAVTVTLISHTGSSVLGAFHNPNGQGVDNNQQGQRSEMDNSTKPKGKCIIL